MKRIGKNKAVELVQCGALLVDMRSPVAFRDGHVSGAVNLPLRNFLNKIMPMDKKTKIIIYSDAVTDDVLRQGNQYAEHLGFAHVFIADFKSLTEETPTRKR
jgi:Rhodanese-related sulfurtransferase